MTTGAGKQLALWDTTTSGGSFAFCCYQHTFSMGHCTKMPVGGKGWCCTSSNGGLCLVLAGGLHLTLRVWLWLRSPECLTWGRGDANQPRMHVYADLNKQHVMCNQCQWLPCTNTTRTRLYRVGETHFIWIFSTYTMLCKGELKSFTRQRADALSDAWNRAESYISSSSNHNKFPSQL